MTQSRKGRKDSQRHGPCALGSYLDLFNAEFKLINGCILAYIPGLPAPSIKVKGSDSIRYARHENFHNHQHFDYAIGLTTYERWQNNLALARGLRAFWECKLSQQFPERRFTFLIWNELAVTVDKDGRYLAAEVVPALRMWSTINDPEFEMHQAFCVEESSLDKICLNIDCRPVFLPISDVFTRKGSIRKKILSREIGAAREMLS